MNKRLDRSFRSLRSAVLFLAGAAALAAWQTVEAVDIDPGLMEAALQDGGANVLLVFHDQQTPVQKAPLDSRDYLAHRRWLVNALRSRAGRQQESTRRWLDEKGIAYRSYWIANVIAAQLTPDEITTLGRRDDIRRMAHDRPFRQRLPAATDKTGTVDGLLALPWGLEKISAADVWADGIDGQGVVIAGADTGYQWDHPALKSQYRGWNGSSASHDYNWHDAVHEGGSSCGADSPTPCDDNDHGTHTMGTMVGSPPGSSVIGVAPGARWTGCRNMNNGWGTTAQYIECMQWFMAPTDLAGSNPDPDRAPDIINNSWGCVPSEGCTTGEELRAAVENVVAGGILFVVSAGNSGPGCSSINNPPAIYDRSFAVAASSSNDSLASFSSRGPVSGAQGITLDIAAPGVNVYSSVRNNGYGNKSGTSMAGPHAAGVAALVMAANPGLRGQPDAVAGILRSSAVRQGITDAYNSGCGGLTMGDWPNWQAGHGRLDARAAVQMARSLIFSDRFESR